LRDRERHACRERRPEKGARDRGGEGARRERERKSEREIK
jgi:hypothetical protein